MKTDLKVEFSTYVEKVLDTAITNMPEASEENEDKLLELFKKLTDIGSSNLSLNIFAKAVACNQIKLAKWAFREFPESVVSTDTLVKVVQSKNIDLVKLILEGKVKRESVDNAFLEAVKSGSCEIAKLFIDLFNDISLETPLLEACSQGNEEMVKLFIECGVNMDLNRLDRKTPLDFAIKSKNIEVVKIVLENMKSIPTLYSLQLAIIDGNYLIFKEVIKKLSLKENENYLLLSLALKKRKYEITKLLLENVREDELGIRHLLYESFDAGFADITEVLISKVEKTMWFKNDINNIFIAACKLGTTEMVKMLIDRGADVNFSDSEALFIAARRSVKIVNLLVANGINVGARKGSALVVACSWCEVEIAKALLNTNKIPKKAIRYCMKRAEKFDPIMFSILKNAKAN